MMLRTLFMLGMLAIPLAAVSHTPAAEAAGSRELRLNVQETGVYAFCLSFEDFRIHRDARVQAISQGLTAQEYMEIAPNTRCYKNKITFVPLQPEPQLDGVGFIYLPASNGRYGCPDSSDKARRCNISTSAFKAIKAELLYGKLRFPVYVELIDAQLLASN